MDGDATAAIAPIMTALGLDGFVLLAAAAVGGELELLVETDEAVTGCPTCGLVATAHGRREHLVRDVPLAGCRWRSCGPSGSGAAPTRSVQSGPGRSGIRRSRRGRR